MQEVIPVYVVNLKERNDRLVHIQGQFQNRNEFDLTIVEAIKQEFGALGLWETIRKITNLAISRNHDYFVLCEDDHEFTKEYNRDLLYRNINSAIEQRADIVLGGPSWLSSFLPIDRELYWVESFTGLQFTIVFKSFYQTILNATFSDHDGADFRIGRITENKYFIYPYISVQKFFGYSDATTMNNENGRVERLFVNSSESIRLVNHVKEYYANLSLEENEAPLLDNVVIPTYIINLSERTERRAHIIDQFRERPEFDICIVEACKHEIGAVGLWYSIRKVIEMAIENEDDVIVICEDDHEFTQIYSKDYFFKCIIESAQQGIEYLSGGCGGFGSAVPVSKNRFWISSILSTQFIVIYKPLFQVILDEPFDNGVKADIMFSQLTSNKMLLYPFISVQKDFGYSDVTPVHNEREGIVNQLFARSQERLSLIQRAFIHKVAKNAII